MPLVPTFNGEPFTSVLGVMRFPENLNKARLYASWRFVQSPFLQSVSDVDLLKRLAKEAAEFAPHYVELAKAEIAGSAVGAITSAMVRMILQPDPKNATWERALRAVRNNDGGLPSGRPLLMDYRRQMCKVAHFWAAYYDRGGQFGESLEEFFTRAESIRRIIFDFEIVHANSTKTGKAEWTIQADHLNAFHAEVEDGLRVAINASPIPGSLWREPIAKRAQKKPSEKNRTLGTAS
jgi:hypothetical protein